jgi:hypothetical protein
LVAREKIMRAILLGLVFLFALPLVAQSNPPQLTGTERLALQEIQRSMLEAQAAQKKLSDELAAFQADFQVAHPGYAFDPAKGIVKEEKPKSDDKKQ